LDIDSGRNDTILAFFNLILLRSTITASYKLYNLSNEVVTYTFVSWTPY